MGEKKRIGIDFDNTLIDYDAVFVARARALRLVVPAFCGGKAAVRAAVRASAGERAWQRLQGLVYGAGIGEALMFEGADAFLRGARAAGHAVVIVSHKTQYSHFDAERVDLRAAAIAWMRHKGFFAESGFGLRQDDVRFAPTRAEKIKQIGRLGCTHFIDDLPEVLDDPSFPPGVAKLLFTNGAPSDGLSAGAFARWHDIAAAVLQ